jgi:hypothetical protein
MHKLALLAAATALAAWGAGPAFAHPHQAEPAHQGEGQVIANGQLHGSFSNGVSCGGDPAAYGLESAHHGPDAGTPGKADGCYATTGGVAPGLDDENPAIG